MKEKVKDRYNILSAAFILFGIIIITQLVNLQIINGEKFDDESRKRFLNERKIIAPRGNIFDTKGVPLALNRIGFVVQIVNADLNDEQLNEVLYKLVEIFEKHDDSYYKDFSRYLLSNPIDFGYYVKEFEDPIAKITSELGLKAKDTMKLKTAHDMFDYLRCQRFKISDKYTDEEAYKIMCLRYRVMGFDMQNPVLLAKDIKRESVAEIEERNREFPGVTTDIEPFREYVDATAAAHILGYIRAIDGEEYEALKKDGYGINDYIGKTGIEKAAEKYLRGKDGDRKIEVDADGRLTEELDSEPAVPGHNVILTLDMKLQKTAMESLQRNIERIKNKEGETANVKLNFGDASAGAVVAIDVHTGEVLVMASYPTYDPSIFLAGPNDKEAQMSLNSLWDQSKGSPAFNRAIGGQYPPGSTFKPLVGIAGIEEGAITPSTKINDVGAKTVEGVLLKCLEYNLKSRSGAHGYIDLSMGLATSCNMYFYELGMQMGIDKVDKWAKLFGLGEYTGIDIGDEAKGVRSNKEYHKKVNDYQWGNVLTAFSSIGQLYNNYTPIQLANYISTLANGGKHYTPHIIKRIVDANGELVLETPIIYEKVPVKKETIEAVKAGMIAVTNSEDGTANKIFNGLPFEVAAKTGTAETGNEMVSNNGVFVAYAPADDPKIAIAIVIEHGVYGKFAAPIARDIISEYFDLNDTNSIDDKILPDEVVFTR